MSRLPGLKDGRLRETGPNENALDFSHSLDPKQTV
jgi:hypothetical protein